MLKPVFTEKSLKMAKQGKYSFWVGLFQNKTSLKSEISKVFGVHVTSIKTTIKGREAGKNARGKKFSRLATKKAIVTLKGDEKIDLYDETKK